MPPVLHTLDQILARALDVTAPRWPPIAAAYAFVRRAAAILDNPDGESGAAVRTSYLHVMTKLETDPVAPGPLAEAVAIFLRVTASHLHGLFPTYL